MDWPVAFSIAFPTSALFVSIVSLRQKAIMDRLGAVERECEALRHEVERFRERYEECQEDRERLTRQLLTAMETA